MAKPSSPQASSPASISLIPAVYIFLAIRIGGGMDFGSLASVMALFTEENAVVAIGPEGGFSDLEIEQAIDTCKVYENE